MDLLFRREKRGKNEIETKNVEIAIAAYIYTFRYWYTQAHTNTSECINRAYISQASVSVSIKNGAKRMKREQKIAIRME